MNAALVSKTDFF